MASGGINMGSIFFLKRNFNINSASRKGMTLAELLFAMAIVATVLLTMIGALTGGLEALQKSTSYNQATILAQTTIENYRVMKFASIPITDSNGIITTKDDFTIKVVIDQGTCSGQAFKKIIVNVTKVSKDAMKASRGEVKKVDVTMESFLID